MVLGASIALFLALLVLGLDVGFSMILGAMLGMLLNTTAGSIDLAMIPMTLVSAIDSEALVAVALFVFVGEAMNYGGLTRRLIDWSMAMVGHFRGALSQAALATNLVMAGISGSAISDATATGTILIPAMKKDGYKASYAAAVISAGAMLGPIMPPSIPLLIYGVLADLSIGRLFLAGVVPGLLLYAGFVAICARAARRNDYQAREKAPWSERVSQTRKAGWALVVPVLIIGGIRSGLVTETEAAGVLCVYALLVGFFVYRDLKYRDLGNLFFSTARTSGVILFLLAAAGPFSWLLNESHMAIRVAEMILGVSDNPLVVLFTINVILLVLGIVFEPLPALVMFVPALIPIQETLGIDAIHFAVVVIVNLMAGMLHPPVGLLILITSAIGRCSLWAVALETIPFLVWSLIVLALISVFPQLVIALPNLVFGM